MTDPTAQPDPVRPAAATRTPTRTRTRPSAVAVVLLLAILAFVVARAGVSAWNRNVSMEREREKHNHWIESIGTGNVEGVKKAVLAGQIELKAPIAPLGNMTALMFAITTGQHEIVKIILEEGADPNQTSEIRSTLNELFSLTPVLAAAKYWSPFRFDMIRELEAHGADLTATDAHGRNILHLNVGNERWADHEMLRWLVLERGFDINQPDGRGQTALILAARYLDAPTMEWLLDNGADPTVVDDHGMTALHYALLGELRRNFTLRRRAEEAASLLLAADPSIASVPGPGGMTPLMMAFRGNADAVPELIQAGADLNATDHDGWTPLMHAVSRNAANQGLLDESIELLIALGANPAHADHVGQTALNLASMLDPDFVPVLRGTRLDDWAGRTD